MLPSRAVITLATGRPVYVDLALNLARSFLHWNRGQGIGFHLLTDLPVRLPPDLAEVRVRPLPPGRYGAGFSPKLWLDELAPADQNLFIDSDCLCFGQLAPVFDRLAGRAVAVVGEARTSGEFFGDISALCRQVGVPWMPVFVGAIYYLERGPRASAVYSRARELERRYDEYGLVRLRGVPNEEPLVALGMAGEGLEPVPDDGCIKADAMHYRRIDEVDVLGGRARVSQPLPDKSVPTTATPVLFHFNSHYTLGYHYLRECYRLRKVSLDHWPVPLASALARLRYDLPHRLSDGLKDLLRPLYLLVCGPRKVTRQAREL